MNFTSHLLQSIAHSHPHRSHVLPDILPHPKPHLRRGRLLLLWQVVQEGQIIQRMGREWLGPVRRWLGTWQESEGVQVPLQVWQGRQGLEGPQWMEACSQAERLEQAETCPQAERLEQAGPQAEAQAGLEEAFPSSEEARPQQWWPQQRWPQRHALQDSQCECHGGGGRQRHGDGG